MLRPNPRKVVESRFFARPIFLYRTEFNHGLDQDGNTEEAADPCGPGTGAAARVRASLCNPNMPTASG